MSNITVNTDSYSSVQVDLMTDEKVGLNETKATSSSSVVPEISKEITNINKETPNIEKPNVISTQQQLNNDCDVMLDSIAKVMGELQKLMAKQREQNSETIVRNLQTAKNENLASAEEIKSSANSALVKQIVGASISMAMSAVSFGLSCASFASQVKNINQATTLVSQNKFDSFDSALKSLPAKADILGAASKLSDSIGLTTKTILDSIASKDLSVGQAKSKEREANAQDLQALIERLKEVNESVKDVQRKTLETLSSVSQADVEVLRKLSV